MNKEFNKIRKLLGNEYHLSETISINDIKWVLYKRYKNSKVYFSKDNEPIMSSDTHTLEQLKEYAKTHHKVDFGMLIVKIYIIIAIINLISIVLNSFIIKSKFISGLNNGISLIIIITCLVDYYVLSKNYKVDHLENVEMFRKEFGRFER